MVADKNQCFLRFLWSRVFETRYRENDSLRDSDLLRFTQCRAAWNFSNADSLNNTSFYLTSYVTDMNHITHRRFFVHLYQPIHWYLTRTSMSLSEQRAPFSTMFAWELSTTWYDHSIVNVQVSIFVTCFNFTGTGCDCDSCL